MFDEIRKGLIESYKHRRVEDAVCVACGAKNEPLALHVIEFFHPDSIETPPLLVLMSKSNGTSRGCVPLCRTCCPPCAQCSLPIATPRTKRLVRALTVRHQEIRFVHGNGFCRHVHLLKDFSSLFLPVRLSATPENVQSPSADDGKARSLFFPDGEAALEYACKFMACPLGEGDCLPALVLDLRKLPGNDSAVTMDSSGIQLAMLRVASNDGGFPVVATTLGPRGPRLEPGQLVAWKAGKHSEQVAAAMGVKDRRSGWIGLIVGTLTTEHRDGNWVGDERFS